MPSPVPPIRVHVANDAPVRDGRYVLYWMIAARRTSFSFALDHAVARARELRVGLLVLEPLRVGYRWASPRLHRFVMDGMADNAAVLRSAGVAYHPYVEPSPGHGSGLLQALAAEASLVVTDTFPCFFLPRMVAAAAARLPVRVEEVDGNGVLPLRAADRAFPTAHGFRRHLHKTLPDHLDVFPSPTPALSGLPHVEVPEAIARRWPAVSDAVLGDSRDFLAGLPLDHGTPVVAERGGSRAAAAATTRFLAQRLDRYADGRNQPDDDVASGLSPWLHFGHVGAHEVVERVLQREDWHPERLAPKPTGSRAGWWGLSEAAEAFLDEVITWREVGYGFCFHQPGYDRFGTLPAWARTTLAEHAADPRPHLYSLDQLAAAQTHDPIWNAAQRQLVAEGRMHNYLRMLWGKNVLAWSPGPEAAFHRLIELNNRFALDGRDPNSYSGIAWCFGRFDRAWGPERPIFGKVRYMSSANTARKLRLARYLERWSD